MKTKIYLLFFALAFIFAGCSDDKEDDGGTSIVLPNSGDSTQEALADDKSTGSGFTFTAKSNWTAIVSETTPKARDTESAGGTATDTGNTDKVTWLKLLYNGSEKYNGGAGTFVLEISLEPNYTGKSRSAKIEIVCGNDKITISVLQEAVDGKGEVPEDPNPVTSITLSENNLSLNIGESEQLFATVQPSNATIRTVVWSSSNPEVATVDAEGVVTAIAPGTTIITVKSSVYDDITATCLITVKDSSEPEPKPIDRVITKIIESATFKSDYYTGDRKYTPLLYDFKYDQQTLALREFKITGNNETNAFVYDYSILNEIRISDSNGNRYEGELNENGYVSKMRHVSEDYNSSLVFTYDNDGYLTRVREDMYNQYYYTWNKGNLIDVSYRREEEIDNPYQYGNELNNKTNIDLNSFFGTGYANMYFSVNGNTKTLLFGMIDKIGKRSNQYMIAASDDLWVSGNEDKIYTNDTEPEYGVLSTYYDKALHGNGIYNFDEEEYPVKFSIDISVVKNERIYSGEKDYVVPHDELEVEMLEHQYGPGPWFRIQTTTKTYHPVYDTYSFDIQYDILNIEV